MIAILIPLTTLVAFFVVLYGMERKHSKELRNQMLKDHELYKYWKSEKEHIQKKYDELLKERKNAISNNKGRNRQ